MYGATMLAFFCPVADTIPVMNSYFFSFDLQVPAVLLLCLAFYSMWNTVVEESITVIKEFGIQIKTKYLFNISEDVLVCLYLLRI